MFKKNLSFPARFDKEFNFFVWRKGGFMKKAVSIFILLTFMLAMFIPLCVYAAKDNEGLDEAIKIAKTKFTIPEDFKDFNFQIDSTGQIKVFTLTWTNKKEYPAYKETRISVDEFGNIISY